MTQQSPDKSGETESDSKKTDIPEQPKESPAVPSAGHSSWARTVESYRWPIVILCVAGIGLCVCLSILRSIREVAQSSSESVKELASLPKGIAEKFLTGKITETFLAAIPDLTSTGSGNLELATGKVTEVFQKTDELRVLWGKLYLGTTASEIRVPVTYRYHLRLDDPWKLEISGQTCIAQVPKIRPSLPPAIHTDEMEKKTDRGWARLNAGTQLAELEKGLTPTLEAYAADPRHIAWVRDKCRATVAEFIKTWLLREEHWRTDRFSAILVIFADETEPGLKPSDPVLRLDE